MGMQWLTLCKLPVFVFIVHGGDARRKGKGRCKVASWSQQMQSSSYWNGNGKKSEEKGLEGMLPLGFCCLCTVKEVQALKQCFSFLQTTTTKKRHEIKGSTGADPSLLWLSPHLNSAVLLVAVLKTQWQRTCFQSSAQYCCPQCGSFLFLVFKYKTLITMMEWEKRGEQKWSEQLMTKFILTFISSTTSQTNCLFKNSIPGKFWIWSQSLKQLFKEKYDKLIIFPILSYTLPYFLINLQRCLVSSIWEMVNNVKSVVLYSWKAVPSSIFVDILGSFLFCQISFCFAIVSAFSEISHTPHLLPSVVNRFLIWDGNAHPRLFKRFIPCHHCLFFSFIKCYIYLNTFCEKVIFFWIFSGTKPHFFACYFIW